jgi:phage gp45-like
MSLNLMTKLRQLIKNAVVSLITDDTTKHPETQVDYNGITTEALRFGPYGLSSNPPLGSYAMLLSPQAREGVGIALIDMGHERFKELKEGEVQIGNYLTRASIKFDEQGNIVMVLPEGGNLTVEAPSGDATVNITGNSTTNVDGDVVLSATGNVNLTTEANLQANVTGNVVLQAGGSVSLSAASLDITGNVNITGAVNVTGDVVAIGHSLATHTHVHGVGPSVTAPPT